MFMPDASHGFLVDDLGRRLKLKYTYSGDVIPCFSAVSSSVLITDQLWHKIITEKQRERTITWQSLAKIADADTTPVYPLTSVIMFAYWHVW